MGSSGAARLLEMKGICKDFPALADAAAAAEAKAGTGAVAYATTSDLHTDADMNAGVATDTDTDAGAHAASATTISDASAGAATRNRILADISLELDRGQSLAISAPSGVGKSTLLSIAGLLLEPTAGTLLIDGVDVATLDDDERSRLRVEKIGFLFQHTQLLGSLRAVENVSVPASFVQTADRRITAAEMTVRAEMMLDALGLHERLYYYPSQMSVGQKRRVATARALFCDPALIIADEPTNDLDAENARIVTEALFARVRSGEAALLFATHDEALAKRADRVLYL